MNTDRVFKKNRRRIGLVLASLLLALTLLACACAVYLRQYYPSDEEAVAAFLAQGVTPVKESGDTFVFAPEGATAGLIFYPGGKVDPTAYLPLLQACADRGILCVLAEMPFRLAVLDVHAADGIREQYPQIEYWYIGGHSLGGSMAAAYLSDNAESFEGLILLAAYSTADLSDTRLAVLSVYGSEDGVMNRKKYDGNRDNLPRGFTEVIIDGGCHAYFGVYGPQKGDGKPRIGNEEQIALTAEAITALVFGK